MAKDSKSKKSAKSTGKVVKKEVASDSDNSDEEELDDEDADEKDQEEEENEDEANTTKASRKSKCNKVKAIKCNHKHPRSQPACNRCLLQTQKKNSSAVGKTRKQTTTSKMGNKKLKASQSVSSRNATKCNKKGKTTKKGFAVSAVTSKSASKGGKLKKATSSTQVISDEDSSGEDQSEDDDDDDNEDNSDSTSDDESDATQEDDDDNSDDSDQSDQSGCEGSKRTIADLIKCCNRREAVRKAAERAALQSVNARSKVSAISVQTQLHFLNPIVFFILTLYVSVYMLVTECLHSGCSKSKWSLGFRQAVGPNCDGNGNKVRKKASFVCDSMFGVIFT